jgi:hypothetical protein
MVVSLLQSIAELGMMMGVSRGDYKIGEIMGVGALQE